MTYFIFFGILLGFIFLGVPIAYALGLSTVYLLIAELEVPLVLIAQNMFSATNSYEFLAIPFFHAGWSLYVARRGYEKFD